MVATTKVTPTLHIPKKMFDLHCHLLPGIDDGSNDLEQSLNLARTAVSNGITHAVVTPHIHPGRYNNKRSTILTVYQELKENLATHNINLQLGFAAEVRLCPEIIDMVSENEIPFYGNYKDHQIMLLELPTQHIPPGTEKLIQWLLDRKILPMIAHPERNRSIATDFKKITPFVEMGCLFQLTASSVAGMFGSRAEKCAIKILENGLATIIASDAHNQEHRPPQLAHGRDAAAKVIGIENANKLVIENPMAIAASQFQSKV